MKRKLLLLFVCLFGALGGVKAWTSVAPEDVRAYYLYNVGKGTYWYGADHNIGSGNTRYTGHTSSLYDATPTRVRISSGNYTFTYYVNGVEYQIRHTDNNGEAVLTGGNANFQLYDKTDYKYTIEFNSDKQRRMRAEDAGTCDYPKDLDNNTVHWRFYAYEEILPDLVAHNAPTCISTAATIVSGWERVTTKEKLAQNPERYFYAIFSAVNPGVMMTTENNRMYYKAAGNPLSSSSYDLFEMENYDGEFAIKSNITGKYYGNTSGAPWDFLANKETLDEGCKVTVTCSNGVYNLQDKYDKGQDDFVGNYLGAWDNMEFVGERLAGNKGSKRAGYFLIYRKLKKDLDMTSRITNPSFEAEDISAWYCNTGSDTGRKENSGNYFMSNVAGTYLFNTWNNGNASEVSQTLSNMPSGFYTLSAVMASDNNETLRLKVGNDVIATSTATGKENGIETRGSFSFSGGNMVIKADANNHWYKADNFRLTCLGGMEDLTPVIGKMNDDVNTAQQNAIDTYNSNKTVANYIAAQEAITNAEASIAAYANAASYLEKVELLLATTNFYTTAAYDNVYGDYKTAYDDNTLEDATAAGLSYKTPSYTPAEARYTDNTANDLLIPGWTIGGNDATTNPGFYINTWSSEDDGNGFAKPFFEYWTSESSLSGTTLVGTKTGLTPNKLYRVTANVRIQGTANSGKIKMQVGTGDEIDVTKGNRIGETSRYMKEYIAVGKTDAYGNLTLKFTVESESNISWLSFRDVMYAEQDDDFTYIIKNADCSSNTGWPGDGRALVEMTAYDGTTRTVFASNNYLNPETVTGQRSQTITIPATGAYKLTTYSKVLGTNNNGYVKIWIGDLGNYVDYIAARHLYTVNTSGNNTSTINSDGSGWVANDIYFTASASDLKTIYINISRGVGEGNNEYAYVSGMKLTYLGTAPEISFDEAVVNPVVETNLANADVTIKRNMKSDRWNTFTVPFDMAIPDGWTVKELDGVSYDADADNYSMSFKDADDIVAGKAYMVKPGSDITEVNADGVTINTTTVTSSEVSHGDYTADFVGNNSYLTAVPLGSYIISNNVFYAVDTYIIQKGFRAYITVGGPSPSSARSTVSYDTEGGVTDIQNVVVNGLEESDAQKDGKYFENNKIVIVKNGIKYGSNGQKLN